VYSGTYTQCTAGGFCEVVAYTNPIFRTGPQPGTGSVSFGCTASASVIFGVVLNADGTYSPTPGLGLGGSCFTGTVSGGMLTNASLTFELNLLGGTTIEFAGSRVLATGQAASAGDPGRGR
jgi:hypothetical protein